MYDISVTIHSHSSGDCTWKSNQATCFFLENDWRKTKYWLDDVSHVTFRKASTLHVFHTVQGASDTSLFKHQRVRIRQITTLVSCSIPPQKSLLNLGYGWSSNDRREILYGWISHHFRTRVCLIVICLTLICLPLIGAVCCCLRCCVG